MKALDVLRQQRDNLQRAAEQWTEYAEAAKKDRTARPGPETCQKRADEFAAKVATTDRIAKVVEAAQAREKASQELCAILMRPTRYGPAYEQEREAQKRALGEATNVLRDALAALDAEEGQVAAPQEEGEHP